MTKSIFDPTNPDSAGTARGGLDRNLGPPARSHSHLPDHLKGANADDEMSDVPECNGADAGEAVCEIAQAEKELLNRRENRPPAADQRK